CNRAATIGAASKACQARLPNAITASNSPFNITKRACRFMDQKLLEELLTRFKAGEIGLDQAVDGLRHLPFESLGYATVDHHRALRQGFPEVVFGQGKTPEQVAGIAGRLLERSSNLLITRTNREVFERVQQMAADAVFHEACGAISVRRDQTIRGRG